VRVRVRVRVRVVRGRRTEGHELYEYMRGYRHSK